MLARTVKNLQLVNSSDSRFAKLRVSVEIVLLSNEYNAGKFRDQCILNMKFRD